MVMLFYRSIVIITSKGRLVTKGPWTKILEKLGAEKNVKLKGNLHCRGVVSVMIVCIVPRLVRLSRSA